jgi:hypothetical protein
VTDSDSTVAGIGQQRKAPIASRAVNVLLLAICVAGLVGILGGRTATTTATNHDYRLTLEYPHTIRPALDAYWKQTVIHQGGFHGLVTIAVTASYFDLFETQGFNPAPAASTSDGKFIYLKFTPRIHSDKLTVRYDSYLQPYVPPTSLLANHATVALVDNGKQLAALHYTTWVLP